MILASVFTDRWFLVDYHLWSGFTDIILSLFCIIATMNHTRTDLRPLLCSSLNSSPEYFPMFASLEPGSKTFSYQPVFNFHFSSALSLSFWICVSLGTNLLFFFYCYLIIYSGRWFDHRVFSGHIGCSSSIKTYMDHTLDDITTTTWDIQPLEFSSRCFSFKAKKSSISLPFLVKSVKLSCTLEQQCLCI